MQLQPVTTVDEFAALEADWNGLFERAGRPDQVFQTFNWCWHWTQHFLSSKGGRSLAIMTGWHDGRLVMVWPLVKERIGLVTCLKWLGEPVSQYGDIVADQAFGDVETLREVWSTILATYPVDVVYLRKVRDDAIVAPCLTSLGALATCRDEAPYLDLTSAASFEAYETRYSAHSRRNRRRLMRRLEERGKVTLDNPPPGSRAADLAGLAIDLKREWLADRGLVSLALANNATRDFMRAVAGEAARQVGCGASALSLDGTPVSLQIGFLCKGHFALHILVYALAHEKSRTGSLHFEALVRRAFKEGWQRIDLLAPKVDYKMDWADGTVGIGDWAVPVTRKGAIFTRHYICGLRRRLGDMASSGKHRWLVKVMSLAGKVRSGRR